MATAAQYQYAQGRIAQLQAELDALTAKIDEQQQIITTALDQKAIYQTDAQGISYTIEKLTDAIEPDAPES